MESIELCEKMRHELTLYKALEKRYPGAMMRIRYEDYILNVNQTLHKMYSHFDEIPPKIIYTQLMNLMHGERSGGAFNQNRKNATASLYKWITVNSASKVESMTSNCRDVLLALGYPLNVIHY